MFVATAVKFHFRRDEIYLLTVSYTQGYVILLIYMLYIRGIYTLIILKEIMWVASVITLDILSRTSTLNISQAVVVVVVVVDLLLIGV